MENNDLSQLQVTGLKAGVDRDHSNNHHHKKSSRSHSRHKYVNRKKRNVLNINQCHHSDCERPQFKAEQILQKLLDQSTQLYAIYRLCRHHFCNKVRGALRKELRNIYRGPDKAYASMDFTGRGYITEVDFLGSLVMKRIKYTMDDVKEYFKQQNLFCSQGNLKSPSEAKKDSIPSNSMNFDSFKKIFFPHLYQLNETEESDEDKKAKQNQKQLKENKEKQSEIITDRLKKLEKILKEKFSNNWESVRKAFLALDSDYDGYITVEDILRYFGQDKDFSYNDLKKLIKDKDSRKIGKIGYTDFSKWVGNSIHMSEGFYFRHDSIKNPQYEKNLEKQEKKFTTEQRKQQQDCLINDNLEKTVLDKMQFQWKTLRKAFMDLNVEKSGAILPEELRFYLKHWGLNLTDEQFKYIFDKFDFDKDGKISYKDFQLTIGSEIHPAEGLYFRQDKPQMMKVNSCKHDKCWQPTHGSAIYCALHQKMHQDQCIVLFGKIFKKIGHKWKRFIDDCKSQAEKDDQNQIFFESLLKILAKYKVYLTEDEKENMLDSFPGRDEGVKKRINIARLYDQKYNMMLSKMYQKIDVHENDGSDDPVDTSGYIGQFYREKRQLIPITEFELVSIISRNNRLAEIVRMIKEIDASHNGYVTSTELDDILKIIYKEELGNKDISHIIRKYSSIQNRILIDYKKFKESMIAQLKMINSTYTYAGTDSSPEKDKEKTGFSILSQMHKRLNKTTGDKTPTQGLKDTQQRNPYDTLIMMKDMIKPNKASKNRHAYTQGRQSQIKDLNKTIDVIGDLNKDPFDETRYKIPKQERLSTLQMRRKDDDKVDLNRTEDYISRSGANNLLRSLKARRSVQNILERKDKNSTSNQSLKDLDDTQIQINLGTVGRNNFIKGKNTHNIIQSQKKPYSSLSKPFGETQQHFGATIQSATGLRETKFKEVLKTKLSYEWKNILRLLQMGDKDSRGLILQQEFEHCTHQCGAFLTREDMSKIMQIYGKGSKFINYLQIGIDLGMQNFTLTTLKTPQSRLEDVQKLRALYSSSEVKRTHDKMNSTQGDQNYGAFINSSSHQDRESTKQEIKECLLKKIKEFRDLVHLYQRKNHLQSAILPLAEFKAVLKAMGLNLQTRTLQRFLVNNPSQLLSTDTLDTKRKSARAKSATGYGNFYQSSGAAVASGSGIDAKEFLKFYI